MAFLYEKIDALREYGSSEYHVRQIFVNNEADSKALTAKLSKKPSAFAEYARKNTPFNRRQRRSSYG